nr:outer membrane beta-barrel protein [Methylobacterium sp. ZNC0032]
MRIRSIALMLGSTALATSLLAAPTLAADYPVLRGSQIEDAPPAPSQFTWEGFYVGGFAGQAQSRFERDQSVDRLIDYAMLNTTIASSINVYDLTRTMPRRDSGSIFGGYAGYNWAFGDVVMGLEADYSRIDQEAAASRLESRRVGNEFLTVGLNQSARINDYASLRARFGYAYGRLMPYFTIGAAVGRFDTNVSVYSDWGPTDVNGVALGSYVGWPRMVGGPKKDVWGFGGVIGGGIEAALTDNILVRAEYLYTRFHDVEGVTTSLNQARVGAALKF